MIKTVIVLELWCERPIADLAVKVAQRAYTIDGSVANAFPLAENGTPSPRDLSLDQVSRADRVEVTPEFRAQLAEFQANADQQARELSRVEQANAYAMLTSKEKLKLGDM